MTEFTIEAQNIPGPDRHNFIFQSFDNLEQGQSLVLVNSHDPAPLMRQFEKNRPNQFICEYIEKGPIVWRIRIAKIKKEGCCGMCGS